MNYCKNCQWASGRVTSDGMGPHKWLVCRRTGHKGYAEDDACPEWVRKPRDEEELEASDANNT